NPVRCYRVRRNEVLLAHLCRVDPQVIGDLVQLDLLSPTRLRSPMAALRAARRLVGENSNGFKSVMRQGVCRRLKNDRVERARAPMTAIGPAIQYGPMVHGGDGSILFISRLRRHQYGMPSAMAVKNLFTRQTDFYGTASDHREFAHNNFVI